MKGIENQKTIIQTNALYQNQTMLSGNQASSISNSPALVALEAKLMRRHRKATPQTYRRPAYLQYIDYA